MHVGFFFFWLLQGLRDMFFYLVVVYMKYVCVNPKFKYLVLLKLPVTKCDLI
jgi:hypothetical protein